MKMVEYKVGDWVKIIFLNKTHYGKEIEKYKCYIGRCFPIILMNNNIPDLPISGEGIIFELINNPERPNDVYGTPWFEGEIKPATKKEIEEAQELLALERL